MSDAARSKLQPLVAEISSANNFVSMARCKDELEREFYRAEILQSAAAKSVAAEILQPPAGELARLQRGLANIKALL